MKKSLLILAGTLCLGSIAQAGAPILLRHGEARRLVLNDGRSILVSCSQNGGRQTAAEIPLSAGRSTQVMLYRDISPTTVSCSQYGRPGPGEHPRPVPPRPPHPIPYPTSPVPPLPLPGGMSAEIIIFSNSDSCQGTVSGYASLIPGLDVLDQCRSQLQNPRASAWSVRTNGQCLNIQDTSALSACAQTIIPQAPGDTQMTIFSNSDSCSGSISASAIIRDDHSQAEQCQDLAARGNGSAWSIRLGNSCLNIQDTNVLSACLDARLPNARPTGMTDAVIYSSSDGCTGHVSGAVSLIPDMDLLDQCSNLTRTGGNSAWSVRANGRCTNIQDTDVVSACLNVRVPSYRGARQVVIFASNDGCSGTVSAAGYIDPRYSTIAQCQALKQSSRSNSAWSVRVDDQCINIQDTDIVSACIGVGI